jgi:hypothetical protein
LDGAKVYITDPEAHPYRIEFLRFDADSPMPEAVMNRPHAAFIVDDLEAALAGQTIIIEPFEPIPTLRCAFIQDGDAILELMQEI